MRNRRSSKWTTLAVLLCFTLLHQADRLIVGPLTSSIMDSFHINEAQMGTVLSGALVTGGLLFPLWGYLFDRFSRARLLTVAAAVWGGTTWLSAIAPTFGWFVASRAATGIDDASVPGAYSLLADTFEPRVRGKVYAALKVSIPVGYVVGAALATFLAPRIGWRWVFVVTGAAGMLVAMLVALFVRDVPRGATEPELAGVSEASLTFHWSVAQRLLKRRTLVALYAQGFLAVIPINVVTFWMYRYLETERGYSGQASLSVAIVTVTGLAMGLPLGGALGDRLFHAMPRGRLLVVAATIPGSLLLCTALLVPATGHVAFALLAMTGAFLTGFAAPNIVATISDISPPEVRSTALAMQSLVETTGAALAPLLTGVVASRISLGTAFLVLIAGASVLWIPCYLLALRSVSGDIEQTRADLRARFGN
ncbi:MAG: MFS transporter [Caldiserica bacterium]|nr:MFS transporter [Caldisericota bacterium]